MKHLVVLFMALFALVTISCEQSQQSTSSTPVESQADGNTLSQRVIYGEDDRLDVFEVEQEIWRTRASSTVALLRSSSVTEVDGGNYQIRTRHFGQSNRLCTSEPFYDQQAAAFCSGSLIAPDVIMTAGHCIRSQATCDNTKFVFNFAYREANTDVGAAAGNDVYGCRELIQSEVNNSNQTDYALIRLDRAVIGHNPLPIRQQGQIDDEASLVVIGHPSGLPTKVAGGAGVIDNTIETHFIADLDTYGGNSGSAVFNAETGVIEGILVRGARDYVFQNGCQVSNVCDSIGPGCGGEDVTRVSEVLPYIDASELVSVGSNDDSDDSADADVDDSDGIVEEEAAPAVSVSGIIQIEIPDSNPIGIRHQLPATTINANTQIVIDIEHTWIGDLSVVVQAPNGERKVLHDRLGASRDNLFSAYNWQALPVLSRANADGLWSIEVKDVAFADRGRLVQWAVDSRALVSN